MSEAPTLYTVGHGARTAEALIAVLREARIALVVDVRRHPGSRRHPQFGRASLAAALAAAGVGYLWEGEALGGLRAPAAASRHRALAEASFRAFADQMGTREFQVALARMLAEAARRPTAMLCAERDPAHCHRRLIADAALARGAMVVHLLEPGRSERARLDPAARICGSDVVYDAGRQGSLDLQ